MVESASLTMLKKAAEQNKAVEAELKKEPVAETPPDEDERGPVDVDTMSDAELNALVKAEGIEVPDEWKSWDVVAKRSWLQTTFGARGDARGLT